MAGWKDEVRRRLQSLRLRPEREVEIVEELSQHLEDRYEALRAEGLAEPEARQAALAELDRGEGLAPQLAEVEKPAREPLTPGAAGRGSLIVDLLRDLRYGVRMLRAAPSFTAIAILTLALGIGANAAIFSVLNAVLLEPLPLPDSGRLGYVMGKAKDGSPAYISYPDFEDLRHEAKTFDGLSGFVGQSVNLTGRSEPMRVRGGFVSDNFFRIVRTEAAQGRVFLPGVDDKPGADLVCVVQHETWKSVFGGDPAFLGSKLILNNEPYTVAGILPEGFHFPMDEIEVWIPYHKWPPLRDDMNNRTQPMVAPVARLKQGVSFEEARAEAEAIMARLAATYPEAGAGRSVTLQTLQEALVGDSRPMLLVLFGAVACVLLIACGNVASLLLARGAARSREFATRTALGASKSRLVRQILAETGLLWLAGGAAGVGTGIWMLAGLIAMAPPLPGGISARFDLKAFAFTLGIT
ncbi:MAG TPA: ABC transporter permease, partial [Candidatus Polarisedimenticolia bacterium]|nr:ABC transporter permease [Candidatus Polarisedimenticolia bacterium]